MTVTLTSKAGKEENMQRDLRKINGKKENNNKKSQQSKVRIATSETPFDELIILVVVLHQTIKLNCISAFKTSKINCSSFDTTIKKVNFSFKIQFNFKQDRFKIGFKIAIRIGL